MMVARIISESDIILVKKSLYALPKKKKIGPVPSKNKKKFNFVSLQILSWTAITIY
jgi:hypothetical protein